MTSASRVTNISRTGSILARRWGRRIARCRRRETVREWNGGRRDRLDWLFRGARGLGGLVEHFFHPHQEVRAAACEPPTRPQLVILRLLVPDCGHRPGA